MATPSFQRRPLLTNPESIGQLLISEVAIMKYAEEELCITIIKKDINTSMVFCIDEKNNVSIKMVDNHVPIVLSSGQFGFYLDLDSKEPISPRDVKPGEIVVFDGVAVPQSSDEPARVEDILIRAEDLWIDWMGNVYAVSNDHDIKVRKVLPCA